MSEATISEQMVELQAILDASNLPPKRKEEILLSAIGHWTPVAAQTAAQSANGDFLKILMQLLLQFLPVLLKLLAS